MCVLHEDGSSYATWGAFDKQDLYSSGPASNFSGHATALISPPLKNS